MFVCRIIFLWMKKKGLNTFVVFCYLVLVVFWKRIAIVCCYLLLFYCLLVSVCPVCDPARRGRALAIGPRAEHDPEAQPGGSQSADGSGEGGRSRGRGEGVGQLLGPLGKKASLRISQTI